MGAIRELFLNEGQEDKAVVEAPAFSITKVMAVVAPLITALVTWATSRLESVEFTSGQITGIIASLIGFLAITGAADVIARGLATSAEKAATGRGRWVRFEKPLVAKLSLQGPDEDVAVVAASDADPPEFLCVREDKSLSWEPGSKVTFS
ncbi:hypothetical protein GA707_20045 [Nostocoides sp. F2B08]|uniref:hypothetical protein n=1 Tax=Nostocoides sp. F2B08 TaxID=2653936 RepID=UPI0012638884|nr:hypothetical protein [Tetrasphaera sp. F2B08]KAB7739771.1 hypothetical protein GA707_20045 [Tetrasphaera sp. F2B08]